MTGAEIYAFFSELVGDSPSDAWFYPALNSCKNAFEAERPWAYLRAVDTSNSRSSSDTWQTAKTLPSDFAVPSGLKVGTTLEPFNFVPFDRVDYKDTNGTARLDLANDCFYFNGTAGTTGTVYLFYQKFTPEITSATSPVFPSRFHSVLAYDMAEKWFAKDQTERTYAWNEEHEADYIRVLSGMQAWDDAIRAHENNSPVLSSEYSLDLS